MTPPRLHEDVAEGLERLRKLRENGTPGPWRLLPVSEWPDDGVNVIGPAVNDYVVHSWGSHCDDFYSAVGDADAALIVGMHAALPALLDLATAAEAVIENDHLPCPCVDRLAAALAALTLHKTGHDGVAEQ